MLPPAAGADGVGLIVTIVVAGKLLHPLTTEYTVYVPAVAELAEGIEGF